jgi:hypothetical protein
MKLTKEMILEKVTEKQIFDHFLKPYHNFQELKAGKNISNPFLPEKQKTPSFNIFHLNGKWWYKDFTDKYKITGDCFKLVMQLKKVNSHEALEIIAQEMFYLPLKELSPHRLKKETKSPLLFTRSFSDYELAFWTQYGITIETLGKFKVKAVSTYQSTTKDGKPYSGNSKTDDPIFAYPYGTANKLYQPKSEQYRFKYLGEKDPDFVFGFDHLPEKGELVIITSGEKDVLSLDSHGFPAICLNSETANVPAVLVASLKKRFDYTLVLYDNDETGSFHSNLIARQHNLINITLPPFDGQIDTQKPLKDISDFFMIGRTAEDLTQLISDQIIKSQEIAKSANSAISAKNGRNIADFADFADFADSHKNTIHAQNEVESIDVLSSTPCIDESVYSQLPSFLGYSCSMFDSPREKDVFLTSALGVLSACMPDFFGVYHKKRVSANLYTFIIAPSGNGKGVMNNARDMGLKYHRYLLERSTEARKKYDKEARDKQKSKSDDQDSTEIAEKPGLELYFIPANSSSSRIYKHLAENPNGGVICETEADTLGQILKKEWGSFSDLLRKLYGHEMSSQSRIMNDQYIEIIDGKLSVVLSGTPNQVLNIISNAEDGLFSRFIFYLFKSKPVWKSPRPDPSRENQTDFFKARAEDMFQLVQFYKDRPVNMIFTIDQWDQLDKTFQIYLSRIIDIIEGDVEGVIYRLGLIQFRICMILTALRNYEGRFHREIMDCHPTDFDTANKIVKTYIEHSFIMFENLPRSSKHSITKRPKNIDLLFRSLPDEFTRKQAAEKATEFGVSPRTVDEYLRREKDNSIHSPKAGSYLKLPAEKSENHLPNNT